MPNAINKPRFFVREQDKLSYWLHRANEVLYLGWTSISLYRFSTFASNIACFFREAKGSLVELGKAGLAGSVASSVAAAAEMVVTTVLFVKSAVPVCKLDSELTRCQPGHDRLADFCRLKKKKDSRADGIKLEKHDGEHYAAYQAAANRWDAASKELTATSVVLTRDTVVQGAGVGANLAQQWSIWNVGGLLQLAKCAVDVGVATIVSGAAGIACGALHVVGGALALYRGSKALERAENTVSRLDAFASPSGGIGILDDSDVRGAGGAFRDKLSGIKATKRDKYGLAAQQMSIEQFQQAIGTSGRLLTLAKRVARRAEENARHHIQVGKRRIAYGSFAAAIGGAALTVALLAGAATPIGWAIAGLGSLASAAWLFYALRRNKKYAEALRQIEEQGHGQAEPPTDNTIDDALALFDGYGRGAGKDPLARKLVKQTLLEIGLTRDDFRVLKFCPEAELPHVRGAIRAKIQHFIDPK